MSLWDVECPNCRPGQQCPTCMAYFAEHPELSAALPRDRFFFAVVLEKEDGGTVERWYAARGEDRWRAFNSITSALVTEFPTADICSIRFLGTNLRPVTEMGETVMVG